MDLVTSDNAAVRDDLNPVRVTGTVVASLHTADRVIIIYPRYSYEVAGLQGGEKHRTRIDTSDAQRPTDRINLDAFSEPGQRFASSDR